jgi:hypothetical protein
MKMLVKHLENWTSWGDDLKERITFIIVDDASPSGVLTLGLPYNLDLYTYRINENIPWNFSGVKNLLASLVPTDWFLLHDIDYMFSEDGMRKMLKLPMDDPTKFYNFKCVMSSSGKLKPKDHYPISSFLVNTDTFWDCGGHDEDFCGHYTCHDNGIFWRLTRDPGLARQIRVDDPFMTCYQRSQVEDADTDHDLEGWSRDGSRNRKLLGEKRQKIKPWSNDSLRFTYKKLQEFEYAKV